MKVVKPIECKKGDCIMTKINKIINIEDTVIKHCNINRALQYNGYPTAVCAKNAEEGLSMIDEAISKGNPFELLITDMEFPVNGIIDSNAGVFVMKELERKGIQIPIIVCSSIRYDFSEQANVVGCVFYNKNRDLNWDFREVLAEI